MPHDVRPPKDVTNHGTVLYTSETLRPNMSDELRIKSCSDGEREGRSGSQVRAFRAVVCIGALPVCIVVSLVLLCVCVLGTRTLRHCIHT